MHHRARGGGGAMDNSCCPCLPAGAGARGGPQSGNRLDAPPGPLLAEERRHYHHAARIALVKLGL